MLLKILLFAHVFCGVTSLITGPMAMIAKKGGKAHSTWGKVYSCGMTGVFVTAMLVQPFRFTPFLFMIAFLSYYTVFSGVRFTRLKKLHQGQQPAWYDWLAAAITFVANLGFIVYGLYNLMEGTGTSNALLSIGFGVGGCFLVYNNTKPFFNTPSHPMYWWIYHMGSMVGGYMATTTAFSTTVFGLMGINSPLIWIWPVAIGIPLSSLWQKKYTKKFKITAPI